MTRWRYLRITLILIHKWRFLGVLLGCPTIFCPNSLFFVKPWFQGNLSTPILMSLSVLLQHASVRSYSQVPKLQFFVKIDFFTIKILPIPNLTTTNSRVMFVFYQRILIESYSKIIEKQDFIKNGLPRESVFSLFKRQIRKNKNPGALIQVIAVKMIVVSSKSVNCSSCATVPKILKSSSLIS